jgi:hypothetical protein
MRARHLRTSNGQYGRRELSLPLAVLSRSNGRRPGRRWVKARSVFEACKDPICSASSVESRLVLPQLLEGSECLLEGRQLHVLPSLLHRGAFISVSAIAVL